MALFCSTGTVFAQVDDHANGLVGATDISLNTSIEGAISPGNDRDVFRPPSSPDNQRLLVFTTGSLDTRVTVRNNAGRIVSEDVDSGAGGINGQLVYTVPSAGQYYIAVESVGPATGDYTLHVFTTDRHGDTRSAARDISLNRATSGAIAPASDLDYFEIDVNTQTSLTIFTTGNLDTAGTLQSSAGANLVEDNNSGENNNFRMTYNAAPGRYFIEVSGENSAIGNYVLRVYSDIHGNTETDATDISLNTSIEGAISPGNDVDFFRIEELTEETQLIISTSGNLDTSANLRKGGAVVTMDNNSGAGNNFQITHTASGINFIEVNSVGEATGDYTLNVLTDTHRDTTANATDISLNSTTAGAIAPPMSDLDYFKIVIREPTSLLIFTAGNVDTAGRLLSSNGMDELTEVFGNDNINNILFHGLQDYAHNNKNFRKLYDIPAETYFIEVRGGNDSATGDYTLHVSTDIHGDTGNTATPVELNTTVSGTITFQDFTDIDYFRIEINQPTRLTIFSTGDTNLSADFSDSPTFGLSEVSNGGYTAADGGRNFLIDPSGIGRVFLPNNESFLATGTYYVAVRPNPNVADILTRSSEEWGSGNYVFHVVADFHGGEIHTQNLGSTAERQSRAAATALPLNTTVSGIIAPENDRFGIVRAGNDATVITFQNDVDLFRIDIAVQTPFRIFTSGDLDTFGRLLDDTGGSLDRMDSLLQDDADSGEGNNFLINRVGLSSELETATYYIEVSSSNDSTTGGYVLHINVPPVISFDQATYTIDEGDPSLTISLNADPAPATQTRIELNPTGAEGRYRLSPSVIVFEPGQRMASFEVSIDDDNEAQPTQELHLSFDPIDAANPVDGNALPGSVPETIITVEDNEIVVSLPQTRVPVTEDAGFATLQIETNRLTAEPLTVNLLYTGDPGALTGDFSSAATPDTVTTVTIDTHLTTEHTFTVDIVDDEIAAEFTRTVNIMLQPGDGYIVSGTDDTVALAVQESDFARASFSQSTGTVTEGESIELTVIKNLASDRPTEVNVLFTSMGNFFESAPIATTQVSFPAEVAMSRQTIIIPTVNNLDVEANGSLVAEIEAVPGSTVNPGTTDVTTVTVLNDDVPAISFESDEYTVVEGTTGTITLIANQTPVATVQISLTTALGTNVEPEERAQLSPSMIVFEAGQRTASFEVGIVDDDNLQPPQTLRLSFDPLNDSAEQGTPSIAEVSVLDDDVPAISFEQAAYTIDEGTTATIILMASPTPVATVQISLTTALGTTVAEGRYQLSPSIIEFEADQSTASFEVSIIDDNDEAQPPQILRLSFDPLNNSAVPGTVGETDITVQSDEIVVSFMGTAEPFDEGSNYASVTLETNRFSTKKLTVNLSYEGDPGALTGDFSSVDTADITAAFTLNTDTTTRHTINIGITDDRIAEEGTRSVDVVLQEGDGYFVSETNNTFILNIRDNDFAYVSFTRSTNTVNEGEAIEFTVMQDLATDEQTTVDVRLDYTGEFFANILTQPVPLSFFPGFARLTQNISIQTVDDLNVEEDGSVVATIINLSGELRTVMPAKSTTTVVNDDVPVAISFERDKYTIDEGSSETITVISEPLPLTQIRIRLDTAGTTAAENRYQLSDTMLVFEPGQSTASFEVSALDNGVDGQQVLHLSLEPFDDNAVPGTVGETVITLQDSETVVSFTGTDLDVTEGDAASVTLYIETNRFITAPLTVNVLYTGDPGALTGEFSSAMTPDTTTAFTLTTDTTTRHAFNVDIVDDEIAEEGTRTAQIVLQAGDGYSVSVPSTVSLNVADNDFAQVSFAQEAGTVNEGATIEFIVTQDLATNEQTTIQVELVYTGEFFAGTLTQFFPLSFPPGEAMSTQNIVIQTVGDLNVEPNGSVVATIISTSGMLRVGTPAASTVTILNDDVPAAISFERAEYTVFEGTTGIITLTAIPPSGLQARIELTATSTMILEGEYELSPTPIVVFQPGQDTTMIQLSVPNTDESEPTRDLLLSIVPLGNNTERGEFFETVVHVRDNAVPIASLEVIDNDSGILPEEGGIVSATLRVTLSRAFEQDTSITIVTEAEGTATEGADYTITNKILAFPMGITYTETTLTVTNDNLVEPDETIILSLDAFDPLIIDDEDGARQTLTIEDNDMPVISFQQAGDTIVEIVEGTTGTIILEADQPLAELVQIGLTTMGTTVAEGRYKLPTTLVFPTGQSTVSFDVFIVNDNDLQLPEELRLSFALSANAILGATTEIVITVLDDDRPAISFQQPTDTIFENTAGTVTLIASPTPIAPAQISLITLTDTTLAADRYDPLPAVIVFPTGQRTVSFDVPIRNDDVLQETEILHLSLDKFDDSAVLGATTETVITVLDNNRPEISFETTMTVVYEQDGFVTLSLRIDSAPVERARIRLTTLTGTTLQNDQYLFSNDGIVEFETGETNEESAIVNFPPDDTIDSRKELHLSFEVLDNNAVPGESTMAAIVFYDPPETSFEQPEYTFSEDAGLITITLESSPVPVEEGRINVNINRLSTTLPNNQYNLPTLSGVVIEPNKTRAAFMIDLSNGEDNIIEPDYELHLSLNRFNSNDYPSRVGSTAQTVITIEDDDVPAIRFERAEYTIVENNNTTITLIADQLPVKPVEIRLTTLTPGTTVAADRYTLSPAVIVFPAGESTASFTVVEITNDDNLQPDQELHLSFNVLDDSGVPGAATETVIFVLDDDRPAISFQQPAYTIDEGTNLAIILEARPTPIETVQVRPSTLTETTVDFDRYQLPSGDIEFEPGESTASFIVSINDDTDKAQPPQILRLSFDPLHDSAVRGMPSTTDITVQSDEIAVSFIETSRTVDEGAGVVTLQIKTNLPIEEELIVNLEYTGDTGALTGEFSSAPPPPEEITTEVTLVANMRTTHTFNVAIKDDQIAEEGTRTAQIVLRSGNGYFVSETASTISLNVADNDVAEVFFSQPTAPSTVTEGDPIEFIVTQDLATDTPTRVTIGFTYENEFFGSMPDSTQLDFPAGVAGSAQTVMIPTVDDLNVEEDGSVVATIISVSGSLQVGTTATSTVTVMDNDNPVAISFEQAEYTIDEGDTIILIADPPPPTQIQVGVTILAGETTADTDRYQVFTFIQFEPGQSTVSAGLALDNDVIQQPQMLHLSLLPINPNAVPGTVDETAITIQDSETVVSFIGTTNLEVIEGENLVATLQTNRFFTAPLTVDLLYTGDPGALTGDFSSATPAETSTEVTLVATDITTRHTFNIAIVDDEIAEEGTRTAQIKLQDGTDYDASSTDNTVEVAVIDNDVAQVSFLPATDPVTEGATIVFTVVRDLETNIPTEATITLAYTGTGNFFEDTPIQTTRLSFPMKGTMITREIMIPTVDDLNVEADGALSAAITMTSGMLRIGTPGVSTVTILNDDVPAAISFDQAEYTITEGTTLIITLTAIPPSGLEARIALTATSTMILKYELSPTPIVVFQPGQEMTTIKLSVPNTDDREENRDLLLSIVPMGNNTTRGRVFETVVHVRDNDVPIASLEVMGDDNGTLPEEGMVNATLRVTLSRAFEQNTSITIVTTGTATLDTDYTIASTQLAFPMNTTSAETTLTVLEDSLVEPDETIMLSLSADNRLIIDDSPSARQTLTIEDDDMPVISFQEARYTIVENTTGTIILEADQPPVIDTDIELTAASAMILNYRLSSTPTIVFKAGERTASFDVFIVDDNDLQATRELRLSFNLPDNNAVLGATSETVITVLDDDMPAISFEQAEYTIDEGSSGTVTLIASPTPIAETRVELTAASALILNTDYRLSSTPTVVFQRGQPTTSFDVFIVDDRILQETPELRLSFNLPDNNAEHGTISETVIRVKDSLAPIASLEAVGRGDGDNILVEAGQSVTLRVTLEPVFAQDTIITIVTTGTATLNTDFTITNTQLTFPMNTTSAETTLRITDTPTLDTEIILSLTADNSLIRADEPESQLILRIGKATLLFRIKVFLEGAQ